MSEAESNQSEGRYQAWKLNKSRSVLHHQPMRESRQQEQGSDWTWWVFHNRVLTDIRTISGRIEGAALGGFSGSPATSGVYILHEVGGRMRIPDGFLLLSGKISPHFHAAVSARTPTAIKAKCEAREMEALHSGSTKHVQNQP